MDKNTYIHISACKKKHFYTQIFVPAGHYQPSRVINYVFLDYNRVCKYVKATLLCY